MRLVGGFVDIVGSAKLKILHPLTPWSSLLLEICLQLYTPFFPTKVVQIHPTDKPWMTYLIKRLILERQRAFYASSSVRWKHLRS